MFLSVIGAGARLLLILVFLVAGISKLRDREGSQDALVAFGIPPAWSKLLGIGLPALEIITALFLFFEATAVTGAILAIGLLALFSIGIVYNLSKGRTPDCHCFGKVYSKPISKIDILRNFLLASIAAIVLGQGSNGSLIKSITTIAASVDRSHVLYGLLTLITALALVEGWLLLHVLRQQGRMLLRIQTLESQPQTSPSRDAGQPRENGRRNGLPFGTVAPPFELARMRGQRASLREVLARGRHALLVFVDPRCGSCAALVPMIDDWQKRHGEWLSIVVISTGEADANTAKFGALNPEILLLQQRREVAELYGAMATPSAVIVNPKGRIISAVVYGELPIRELVAEHAGYQQGATPLAQHQLAQI